MKRIITVILIFAVITLSLFCHFHTGNDEGSFIIDYDDYYLIKEVRTDRYILGDHQRSAQMFIEKSLFDDDLDEDGISTIDNYYDYLERTGCKSPQSLLSHIQSEYRYMSDWDLYGIFDWAAYPIETIAAGKGDCEDLCILFISIMVRSGYDCGVAVFDDHAVAMLSIDLNISEDVDGYSPFSIERDAKTYYAFETTGDCSAGYTFSRYDPDDLKAFVVVRDVS